MIRWVAWTSFPVVHWPLEVLSLMFELVVLESPYILEGTLVCWVCLTFYIQSQHWYIAYTNHVSLWTNGLGGKGGVGTWGNFPSHLIFFDRQRSQAWAILPDECALVLIIFLLHQHWNRRKSGPSLDMTREHMCSRKFTRIGNRQAWFSELERRLVIERDSECFGTRVRMCRLDDHKNIGERRGARSLRYIDEKRLEGSGHSGKYGV